MSTIKTCEGCGQEFKLNFPKQRYCSRSCWHTSAENQEAMLERWQHPEFQALVREVNREAMLKRWRNPEYQALISEMMRECWQKPEYRVPVIEAIKAAAKRGGSKQ